MPTEKWTTMTSRGEVLTTQLNSLAAGAYSNGGTEVDNASNLDRWGIVEVNATFGSSPTDKGSLDIFAVIAPDGTNYSDGASGVRPSDMQYLGTAQVRATTSAQRLMTQPFVLPPCKFKLLMFNNTSQALPASGTTAELFTFNRSLE